MTDRPIIFSGPMVKALLDGRKTQTRRILKLNPKPVEYDGMWMWTKDIRWGAVTYPTYPPLPYAPGDRLWVREAFWICDACAYMNPVLDANSAGTGDRACCASCDALLPKAKTSPIFMPRHHSRLTLTVTEVRLQRLTAISEHEAQAEGARPAFSYPGWDGVSSVPHYRWGFAELWNSIHGPKAWDANPWVVVVAFTVEKANIDRGVA